MSTTTIQKWLNDVRRSVSPIRTGTVVLLTVVLIHASAAATPGPWTWIAGSAVPGVSGVYGTIGVPAPGNMPGARTAFVTWLDDAGNFWLFGGEGEDAFGNRGLLNDLWRYDGANWAWVAGSDTADAQGDYGPPLRTPGGRRSAGGWTDDSGNLWLFGGLGYTDPTCGGPTTSPGQLNDLWMFNGSSWLWFGGNCPPDTPGQYGTRGVTAPGNRPGSRYGFTLRRAGAEVLLFGGFGLDAIGASGMLDDLWMFDGAEWTWIQGTDQVDSYATFDPPDSRTPGGRGHAVSWVDTSGQLWIAGGFGASRHTTDIPYCCGDAWDVWRFDGIYWNHEWGSGGELLQYPSKQAPGVTDPSNRPGSLRARPSWVGSGGDLWVMGGYSNAELWRFDGANWTWMGGFDYGLPGHHGTRGVADLANHPGSVGINSTVTRDDGTVLLFGGLSYGAYMADLWEFDAVEFRLFTDFPIISSVADVPGDQGKQVRVSWRRSRFDDIDNTNQIPTITDYALYRRFEPGRIAGWQATAKQYGSSDPVLASHIQRMASQGWDFVAVVPALSTLEYSAVVTTLRDSTLTDGMHYSTYFVSALTPSPSEYFDSPADSGYSVDNLSPVPPANFNVVYNTGNGNALAWDRSPESDVSHYNVYRASGPTATASETPGGKAVASSTSLVHTTAGTFWNDPEYDGGPVVYLLGAVDYSGNESFLSAPGTATGIVRTHGVSTPVLHPNVPNPFNPVTLITYEVPAPGALVDIGIYDVSGKRVRTLVSQRVTAGRHEVRWDGRSRDGVEMPTGVYFCRLRSQGRLITRKMVLLK